MNTNGLCLNLGDINSISALNTLGGLGGVIISRIAYQWNRETLTYITGLLWRWMREMFESILQLKVLYKELAIMLLQLSSITYGSH